MTATTNLDPADVDEVLGHLVTDMAATAGLQMIQVGIRTGLWRAMAGAGALTPADVAARAGVAQPYAREWLKHQAASGYVSYDPGTATFELPPAVAAVLADDDRARLVEGFAMMLTAMARDGDLATEAFRTGRGIGWHQRSAEHWHGMDLVTRAQVVPALVHEWIPSLGELHDRLRTGARVADVGCGFGATLLALAEAYPASRFWGFDSHDGSIAHARTAAAEAGVTTRTTFEVAAADQVPDGAFDLVLFVDALHDLGDPVGALRRARQVLRGDGSVLLVEFAAADRLEDNFSPLGRLKLAASALVCTANALAQGATDPLGSIPGEARLREVATSAGFRSTRRLPLDVPLNLVLELRP